MAVKITNSTDKKLVLPLVNGRVYLKPRESRIYERLSYDEVIIYPAFSEAIKGNLIKVENLDNLDIKFNSDWDKGPHLTIGDYEYWIDAHGVTRVRNGKPLYDEDGEVLGSDSSVKVPIYSEAIPVSGRTFSQVRLSFFRWFPNEAMGTWDTLYKYCLWSISYDGGTNWTGYFKFDTESDFFTWLESVVPSSGGTYTVGSVLFRIREQVDTQDTFPKSVAHRNSLVASIIGRGNYNSRWPVNCSGVDPLFNSPSYYNNYYNELGRRIVQANTGVLPATNNDGVVWHTRRTRSKHGLPKVGTYVTINSGARDAVWDTVGSTWVTPAPGGSYTVQSPLLLTEWNRKKLLSVSGSPSNTEWGIAATNSVSAIIFPVINSGSPQYRAYVIYPYNYDSFSTEKFDTSEYELTMKLVYRNTSRPIYKVVQPWPTVGSDGEHLMWSHWTVVSTSPLNVRSVLNDKAPGSSGRNPDSNTYPDRVYIARRHKEAGIRSNWYPLYSIRRRTPYSPYRIMPSRLYR